MNEDLELINRAKNNDKIALDKLINKYYNTLYIKSLRYNKNDIDIYLNEAKYSLYKAVKYYNNTTSFATYLNRCLDKNLYEYYKKTNNKIKTINDDNIEVIDNNLNPEIILINEYNYNNLKNKIVSKLTWKEELILSLKEQNFTVKEISEIIDDKIKTIYNTINRIKIKTTKIMSN